jgi:hypothetical protein
MSVEATYKDIQRWMSVNRPVLQEIYQQFLYIYSVKHDLNLKNTKSLYHDFCLHLYYNYVDDYGYTLFESQEEKNAHYNRFRRADSIYPVPSEEVHEENDDDIEFEEEDD